MLNVAKSHDAGATAVFHDFDFSNLGLFGELHPRQMPPHFFRGYIHLSYDSAIKADVSKQNYTVAPRHWYIDATIRCFRCRCEFCFSADEQKVWYEDYGFYVDSFPKRCERCRRELRELSALRHEYYRDIAAALRGDDLDSKLRIASVIDALCEFKKEDLPAKLHEKRELLARQIARLTR